MNRIFYASLSFLLIVGMDSAAYGTSPQVIGPKQQACINGGGNWDVIYDPDQSCPLILPDGKSTTEDCGHCFNLGACQFVGGIWDPAGRRCLYNNHLYSDYPDYCNGSRGGTAPDGGYNPYSANICVASSSGGNTGSQGDVHCPPGYAPDPMGVCVWAQSGPNTGLFCIDNPLLCVLNGGFVYTELPMELNCITPMDTTDDSQLCGPELITAPNGSGKECLSRGGSIASDSSARRLVCWLKAGAGAISARLEFPADDAKAKGVLKNCRAKGHSVTIQKGALACIETPREVMQIAARHFARMPRLACKPPTVANKNRSACVRPAGTERKGLDCIRTRGSDQGTPPSR